jgi:hypothetical protein
MTAGNAVTFKEKTGVFVEATASPNQFKITVIKSGLSKNKNFYSAAALREAVPLFEGARVFMKSDAMHLQGGGKDVSRLIGGLRNVAFVESETPDNGSIVARLVIIEPGIAEKLASAINSDMLNLFGFSIDAEGDIRQLPDGVREAVKFKRVHSVDMIVEAGAGGKLDGLIREAYGFAANDEPKYVGNPPFVPQPQPVPAAAQSQGVNTFQMVEAITALDMVANCKLPDQAKQRIREAVVHNPTITHAVKLIEAEGRYLESVGAFKEARMPDFGGFIDGGESQSDKAMQMLDDFFSKKVHSMKETYRHITGDMEMTGQFTSKVAARLRETAPAQFREAISSTTFPLMFGDSVNKRMIKEYQSNPDFQIWRPLVDVVPLGDFKTQHRIREGQWH